MNLQSVCDSKFEFQTTDLHLPNILSKETKNICVSDTFIWKEIEGSFITEIEQLYYNRAEY